MTSEKIGADKATALHRLAEERLKERKRRRGKQPEEDRTPAETQRLIQELQIHQIELEMQNEELRKSRVEIESLLSQYTDLYDFAPVGYCTIDHEGTICRINLTGAQLLGKERTKLLNQRFRNFVSEVDLPIFKRFLQEVFTKRAAVSGKAYCEVTLCNQQGRKSSFESSGSGHTAEATRYHVYIEAQATESGRECRAVIMDITEHKMLEDTLSKSEALFRGLYEGSPIGIELYDCDGTLLDANRAALSIFGVSDMSAIKGFKLFEDPNLSEEFKAQLRRGESVRYEIPFDFEKVRALKLYETTKNGTIYLHLLITPFGDFTKEPAIGYLVHVHDITERKQGERVLHEREERYRNLFNNAEVGMFRTRMDGSLILDMNEKFLEIFGRTREEMEGNPSVIHWADPQEREEMTRRFKAELRVTDFECKMLNKRGEVRNCLTSLRAYPDQGILEGSIIDITDRKRAEEENRSLQERLQRSEKMEALGTLAGGVAHDLNNVLGVVVGYSEMLLDGVDKSSPLRRRLENVMNGGLRAAAIVDDLLTLARRGVHGRSILNLNKIVVDCEKSPEFMDLLSHHTAAKITTNLEPDLLNISGSSVHLVKTIYNLISNASEAMPKGGTVTIRTANQYLDRPIHGYDQIQTGDYIVLSVSDTGEGISANDLKRIFEPFYTKKIMGRSGTGLGLSVVWGTVKDHNGYINVESEEGKGSTFTLYFPVTREDVTIEAAILLISEYMGKGETILVVDDVKEQRDLATGMLGKLNYNVATVSSGEDAVAYLKEHEVDLMVLDMIMDPGMDGLDTYKSVLNIRPNQKAIIVSGYSESDRVKEARSLGAGAFVRKPYIKQKLGLAVSRELNRK